MTNADALLGIRVLDLTRVLAGPFCTMLLADMGAEVIKLEIPERGDDSRQFPPFKDEESLYYINLNRGKKSITLNLKHPEGKRTFIDLVKKSDVLIENFRPGTMKKLGLDYEILKKINPRLVYAAISGFGQTGPYKERPGYDIIGQAMGGLMSVTGWPDGPPTRSGTAIGDILSALFSCVGILSALKVREQTSRGQLVDVSLVDSVYAAMENIPQRYFIEGHVPERLGNRYEFIYPYDSFKAADGYVIIGIANDAIWERFISATGLDVLGVDDRFAGNPSRVEHHEILKLMIEKWTASLQVWAIVDLLTKNRDPSCPIYDLKQASEDPHTGGAREMVITVDQPGIGPIRLQGNPIKMSDTRPKPQGPAPRLGSDNIDVLSQVLGLELDEIEKLEKDGVL